MTDKVKPAEAVFKAREGLWVLSGGKPLAGVKRVIDRKDFGGEKTLSEYLAVYNEKYDYAIVDTSPGWDPLTVNVLFYVDEILAPVSLEVLTLQGLVEFLKSLATIQNYRDSITLRYILPTFLDNRVKKSESILQKLKDKKGRRIFVGFALNAISTDEQGYVSAGPLWVSLLSITGLFFLGGWFLGAYPWMGLLHPKLYRDPPPRKVAGMKLMPVAKGREAERFLVERDQLLRDIDKFAAR